MAFFRQNNDTVGSQVLPMNQDPAPLPERTPAPSAEGTVIGQGLIIEGTVTGTSFLRLDGTLKGDINIQGAVSISPSGMLIGTIDATDVHISGSVKGDVVAHGRLWLADNCRMLGDVQAELLVVEEGAQFEGRSSMLALASPPAEKLEMPSSIEEYSEEELAT